VADENSLMMIVYQGNNYQIRVGDLLSVAGVPTTRQVIAGTGLQGGGQLANNVTLSIAPGGVGTTQLAASGVTPGSYGSSTEIPVVTVDATGRVMSATTIAAQASGVPLTREVIAGIGLNGGGALNANVTLNANLSDATPLVVDGAGSAGVSTDISRADHQHPAVDLSDADQINGILPLDQGGTARSLVPEAGAIIWCGADGLYVGPAGSAGQVLVSNGANEYTWGSALLVVDQPANVIYAGPAAGPDAPTAFRAMVNADLPNSGVAANTYGSATAIPILTVNAKGVVTSASTVSFTGGLSFQGGWNASTNTPTLTSSTGVNGYYYIVSTAGSTNLDGITDWQIGDWAIFNGTTWQKIDQTDLVASVNGQVGVVVLSASDVGAQPADAQLTDIAGLTPADGTFIVGDGTNFIAESGSTARSSMGLGTIATQNADNVSITGGSVNGTIIGAATAAAGTFTTASATTFDTNVASAGVTLSGTTMAADGTDANITIQLNPKGNGGVGIGGDTSGVVAGVPVTSKFCVKNDGDAPVAGFVHANNTTAGSGSGTFACRSRGTIASPALVQSGDSLWNMFIAGYDGTDLALAAIISVEVDGTPGSNDMPARMVFSTTPDGSQIPVEAMRITSAQIVQIGNADINGGSIDGTTIGAAVAAAITGTTITASTQFSGAGTGLTGTATGLSIGGNAATATSATTAGSATTATDATNAANVATTATSTNADFFLPFVAAATTGNQALGVDAGLTYNPSTNAMTTGINGGTF
jgi:hypothetical protein